MPFGLSASRLMNCLQSASRVREIHIKVSLVSNFASSESRLASGRLHSLPAAGNTLTVSSRRVTNWVRKISNCGASSRSLWSRLVADSSSNSSQKESMALTGSVMIRVESWPIALSNSGWKGKSFHGLISSRLADVVSYGGLKVFKDRSKFSGSRRGRDPSTRNLLCHFNLSGASLSGNAWDGSAANPEPQESHNASSVVESTTPTTDLPFAGVSHGDSIENFAAASDQKVLGNRTLKLLSGSCYLPHPDKEETGGEDAHFICADEEAIGVADGVGGWAEVGIDAGQYSRELMSHAVNAIQEEPKGCIDPARVLEKAHSITKARGSSTACIIALTDQGTHAVNLGDSGFIAIRDGCTVFRSPIQQHDFNFTYQLKSGSNGDLPSSAQVFNVAVVPGDVVVAGTDGLFDNLYNNEVTAVVVHAIRAGLGPPATAQKIAALARQRALDQNRQTPFSTAAQESGYRYYGGKLDDITVVVSYITSSSTVEYNVSYVYHSLFAYFDRDNVALKGFAKFFKESSDEERDHAVKLMEYQNKRGGRVKLQAILSTLTEFDHPEKGEALHAMELALSLEKLVNQKLVNLHEVASTANDVQLADFIESEFLGEQVEASYQEAIRLRISAQKDWERTRCLAF